MRELIRLMKWVVLLLFLMRLKKERGGNIWNKRRGK